MSRVKNFDLMGKQVLFMDYSDLKLEHEILEVIEEGKKYIRNQPQGSVLSLADITNMHFNTEIKSHFVNFTKGNKPYVKASAIVGVTGLKQFIFNGVMQLSGRDVKTFNDLSKAKEWLATH